MDSYRIATQIKTPLLYLAPVTAYVLEALKLIIYMVTVIKLVYYKLLYLLH